MAPERSPKRQKTTPEPSSSPAITAPTPIPAPHAQTTSTNPTSTQEQQSSNLGQSWYSSWSRKAPPVAQVARESIKSASSTVSEAASSVKDAAMSPRSVRTPSLAMTLGKGRSSRASLADATTTMVHAEVSSPARKSTKSLSIDSRDTTTPKDSIAEVENTGKKVPEAKKVDDQAKQKEEPTTASQQETQNPPSSWLGWLSKGDTINPEQNSGASASMQPPKPEPVTTTDAATSESLVYNTAETTTTTPVSSAKAPAAEAQGNRRSWLPIWNTDNDDKRSVETTDPRPVEKASQSVATEPKDTKSAPKPVTNPEQPLDSTTVSTAETSLPPGLPQDGAKAAGWAFWSRDRKANDSSASVDKPREGEIAISGTTSQDHPRRASLSVPKVQEEPKPEPRKPDSSKAEGKKVEANKAVDTTKKVESSPSRAPKSASKTVSQKDAQVEPGTTKVESANAKAVAIEPVEDSKPVSVKSAKASSSILLPPISETLKLPDNPPTSWLLRLASLLYVTKEPEFKHLSLVKDPPRIKNALAIGVHGYFPAPLIRTVLGQPTGTSIKFADMAAKSIKNWTTARGYECSVKTAALEGEGKIAERVELLWKLLLNWIEEIRKSDFIMIACHSQGVPVAIMLVSKLIQFGCIGSARVCICAMAGINMGPFPEYKSRWIGGSAAELFDFTNPQSRVSQDYLSALEVVLKFGVHLTFIGSIDDQLVSLESSVFAPISHPHIFRAVSIDSKVHAPSFLSHLVGFVLKLQNLGIQDHGLIRELSSPLAGSLYTGEGHSRIYEDNACYDLAVSFALETTAFAGIPMTQRAIATSASNPYILPFAMRGILEEDFVKNELQGETSLLLKEFDDWKPTSKVLKDVKFRLEGIRSKL